MEDDTMQDFIERVADFAVRNGYEISEEGFEQAMNDYVEGWTGTLKRLQSKGDQVLKLMYAKGLQHAITT